MTASPAHYRMKLARLQSQARHALLATEQEAARERHICLIKLCAEARRSPASAPRTIERTPPCR